MSLEHERIEIKIQQNRKKAAHKRTNKNKIEINRMATWTKMVKDCFSLNLIF